MPDYEINILAIHFNNCQNKCSYEISLNFNSIEYVRITMNYYLLHNHYFNEYLGHNSFKHYLLNNIEEHNYMFSDTYRSQLMINSFSKSPLMKHFINEIVKYFIGLFIEEKYANITTEIISNKAMIQQIINVNHYNHLCKFTFEKIIVHIGEFCKKYFNS